MHCQTIPCNCQMICLCLVFHSFYPSAVSHVNFGWWKIIFDISLSANLKPIVVTIPLAIININFLMPFPYTKSICGAIRILCWSISVFLYYILVLTLGIFLNSTDSVSVDLLFLQDSYQRTLAELCLIPTPHYLPYGGWTLC